MPFRNDPPETAEKLIQQVNRKTRKKFSAEEKIRIVLEGMKREIAEAIAAEKTGWLELSVYDLTTLYIRLHFVELDGVK